MVGAFPQAQEQRREHPLAGLRYQEGWILLGIFDLESQRWASVLKHRWTSRDPIVPRAGDLLSITMPQEVFIVGFDVTGERDHLSSPANVLMSSANKTGVVLPEDVGVVVKEVQRGKPVGQLQSIWARVGPPG